MKSLAEGLSQDVSRHAHIFVQLRGLHPFAAATVGISLVVLAGAFARSGDARVQRLATWLGLAVIGQIGVGILNLVLLAPAAMQLAHLFAADVVWITFVLLAASALSRAGAASPELFHPAHSR